MKWSTSARVDNFSIRKANKGLLIEIRSPPALPRFIGFGLTRTASAYLQPPCRRDRASSVIFTYIYIYIYIYIYVYIYKNICIFIYTYIYIYICIYIYVYICVCVCARVCVCMYIYMYISIYIDIDIDLCVRLTQACEASHLYAQSHTSF